MPDCADMFGFRGADDMVEELDDGAGVWFRICPVCIGEVVYCVDVHCRRVLGIRKDINSVSDEWRFEPFEFKWCIFMSLTMLAHDL